MTYMIENNIRLRLQTLLSFGDLKFDEDINRVGRTFKSISKYQIQSVWVYMNCISINHGLMQNVEFLDQGKQSKLQWVQDPIQSNVDNLNNVRHKDGRLFRNKEKVYRKVKFEELSTVCKNIRDMYSGINDFKKC